MVLWGQPEATFALHSAHREVEKRAREMFSAWNVPERNPDFSWEILKEADGYRLVPPSNYAPLTPDFVLSGEVYSDLDTALLNVEFQSVAVLSGRPDSPIYVHGALLCKEGEGLALVGPKETGKSTLSTYLWTRGWQLLADDGFWFQSGVLVRPVPRRVRLRPTAGELLPDVLPDKLPPHSHFQVRHDGTVLFQPVVEPEPVPLKSIILLSSGEGPLKPVDSACATLEALTQTNCYRIHGIGGGLARLTGLLAAIRCYRMGRASLAVQYERISQL